MVLQQTYTDTHWSDALSQQIAHIFFYEPAWLDILTKLYGYTIIPLTTTNAGGRVTGFLPLCLMQSPLTGNRLVSLPFSDYCPLLAEDEQSAHELLDQAIRLAQEHKARYLELRPGTNTIMEHRDDFAKGDLYVRWQLPLDSDPALIWSQLRKPVQHQVKKARKLGVQVRIARQREEVQDYYRLHLHTRSRKQGMPAQPAQFFNGLWNAFADRGQMQVLLAEHAGKTIAGMVLLTAGKTVRYAYGASDEHYLHLAPNNLLMWEAIEWGCTHGYRELDMGRTARDNEGLMEFKRRWGANQEPLPYYYHPDVKGLASTSEQSWKYHLLTGCWKRLPLQVAGPLGGYLYKHLG